MPSAPGIVPLRRNTIVIAFIRRVTICQESRCSIPASPQSNKQRMALRLRVVATSSKLVVMSAKLVSISTELMAMSAKLVPTSPELVAISSELVSTSPELVTMSSRLVPTSLELVAMSSELVPTSPELVAPRLKRVSSNVRRRMTKLAPPYDDTAVADDGDPDGHTTRRQG